MSARIVCQSEDAGGVLVLCSASLHLDGDEQICSVNLNLMFYRNVGESMEKITGRKYSTFAYGRNIGLYVHVFGGKLVLMSPTSPERWLMGPSWSVSPALISFNYSFI